MTIPDIIQDLTAHGVMIRFTNLEIGGMSDDGNVFYVPKVHITLGIRGGEKYHLIGDDLDAEMFRAYEIVKNSNYLQNG